VDSGVFGSGDYLKVFWSIVAFISVEMMNDVFGAKAPPFLLFRNNAMLVATVKLTVSALA